MSTTDAAYGFQEEEAPGEKFDLNEYLRRYLRYWYLFPIGLLLAVVGAYYYLKTTQPVYEAKASLMIKDQKKGVGAGTQDIMSELGQFTGNKLVENEIHILGSRTLMAQVVKELHLEVGYWAKKGLSTLDLYKKNPISVIPELVNAYGYLNPMPIELLDSLHYKISGQDDILSFHKTYYNEWGVFKAVPNPDGDSLYREIVVRFLEPDRVARGMAGRLTVTQPNFRSTVLELVFHDTSIQKSTDVLNKLLDVYVGSSLSDKNKEASNTLDFIEERLGLITGELGEVERDVESYKSARGLTDIGAESKLFLENIQENDAKLNEINIQIRVLESVDNYIRNSADNSVAPATYMINDPVLVSLLNKFSELNLQREKYARTTQAGNPLLETVNTQLATTKQAILDNVQNLRRGLDLTRQNLEGINTRFSAGLRSIPQKEREYVGIKRQQTIKENLYLYLLQKREETALAYASTVTDSRLVDAPSASSAPVSPKKAYIALAALAIGFIIPVLLINLLFVLNNTVQGREELERISGTPVIGEIGKLKQAKNAPAEEVIKVSSRSAVAEQFRALRTNLQYLGDGSCRVLMFTSSIGGEGKSFVSINLAASLAYSDKKVILVGADLRKPTLHLRLPVQNTKGLTNYLVSKEPVETYIKPSGVHPLFDILPSGPVPPNPSELLSNGKLPMLLKELKEKYDYVLIDSPPNGLVTDAALISEYAEATLYLVRYNYTLRDHLKRIRDLNRTRRFANLSVVFNAVNYGAGYGYGYGYGGYGYGYYDNDKESKMRSTVNQLGKLLGKS